METACAVVTPRDSNDYCALLLAAGAGRRYQASTAQHQQCCAARGNFLTQGCVTSKLLARLPEQDVCVAQASARTLKQVCQHVIAVIAPDTPLLAQVLQAEGCQLLLNPQAHLGMGTSLALGAQAVQSLSCQYPTWRGVLVALADMPWIQPETIRALCAVPQTDLPLAPFYQDQRGHPVRFGLGSLKELAGLQGDVGAGMLLHKTPPVVLSCDDPGVLRDVDTVQDLYGVGAST